MESVGRRVTLITSHLMASSSRFRYVLVVAIIVFGICKHVVDDMHAMICSNSNLVRPAGILTTRNSHLLRSVSNQSLLSGRFCIAFKFYCIS